MGLDCYIVHGNDRDKGFTSIDDERLKDIQLCGGLFSGSGSDGSFRGKVYDPLIQELSDGEHSWYIEQDEDAYIPSDILRQQADLLESFLEVLDEDYTAEKRELKDDDIVYTTHKRFSPYEEEYTLKEVKDLMTLLRVAAERRAVMCVWY